MIIREFYETREDDVNLYVTYSDRNVLINKVGTQELYDKAIDIENASYEYIETDIIILLNKEEDETEENNEISSEEFQNMLEEVL